MNDGQHYHTKTNTTFFLHVENNTRQRTFSSRKYHYPLVVAFDDTSTASISVSIHHHHKGVSLHLQVASFVVVTVVSTATVAAVVAVVEASVLVEPAVETATTVVAVALASVAESMFVTVDLGFVTASNLVFAISAVTPVVA
ncbi:hypothetical protein Hanom_Chr13g01189081 [Helianthus anomalus]